LPVECDVAGPFRRHVRSVKDRRHRTLADTGATVDTFVRVNVEHLLILKVTAAYTPGANGNPYVHGRDCPRRVICRNNPRGCCPVSPMPRGYHRSRPRLFPLLLHDSVVPRVESGCGGALFACGTPPPCQRWKQDSRLMSSDCTEDTDAAMKR